MSEPTRPEAAPPSAAGIGAVLPSLLTDGAVLAFAAWTVGCHVLVLAGATARALDYVAGLVVLGAIAVIAAGRRSGTFARYAVDGASEPPALGWEVDRRARLAGAASLVLALVLWASTRSLHLIWSVSALWLGVVVLWLLRSAPDGRSDGRTSWVSRRAGAVLGIAAAFCASVSLIVNRPRTDDAFYVNMALSAVDDVDAVLLGVNRIHGPPSDALAVQPLFPPYRVHTFELLVGWLSRVTGVDVVVMEHMVIATLLAALLPYALFRLLRILAPDRWKLALVAVIAFYLIEGSASRGYANQALVRLFHGKSVMLTLATPLLCAYALRFAARPSAWRWGLLAASQVAALGLSSTAIWWAPTMAMVAVAAGVVVQGRSLRTCALGLLSTLYPLAVGAWVKVQLLGGLLEHGPSVARTASRAPELASGTVDSLFAYALPVVLGPERTVLGLLCAVGLACVLSRGRYVVALLSVSGLVVALVFANPWLATRVASDVTGVTSYQRVFWLLPVPLAVSMLTTGADDWLARRFTPRVSQMAALGLLAVFFLVTTERAVVTSANGASLKFPPTVKQWAHAREVVITACQLAPAGRPVLAPSSVMLQLGTRSGCAPPLLASERWLATTREDLARRQSLEAVVDERRSLAPEEMAWFVESLDHYDVGLVVLSKHAMRVGITKSLLRWAGFARVVEVDWDHVWVRPWKPQLAQHAAVARALCKLTPRGSRVAGPFGVLEAVGKAGCNEPIADPGGLEALGPEYVDHVRLENLLHTSKKLDPPVQAWMKRVLSKQAVRVVVVRDYTLENRSLKQALRNAGFSRRGAIHEHRVFIKE